MQVGDLLKALEKMPINKDVLIRFPDSDDNPMFVYPTSAAHDADANAVVIEATTEEEEDDEEDDAAPG